MSNRETGPNPPPGETTFRSAEGTPPGQGRRRRRSRGHGNQGPVEPAGMSAPAAPAQGQGQGQGNRNRHRKRNRNENQPNRQGGFSEGRFGDGQKNRNRDNRQRRVRPAGREHLEIQHHHEDDTTVRRTEHWWAERWLAVLHRFGWKGRLANGQRYADEGRVASFEIETGRIRAKVQGSRLQPYDVTIQVKPLPDIDWDLVVEIMSCQALFTAQLLAGDMPQEVEEVFDAAQASLFPKSRDDIRAHCTCPDQVVPCKHIAAVYYKMAEAFDKDPFLIFHLRGRSREALLAMLRAQRAAEAQAIPMSVESLDAGSLEVLRFWQAGEELEGLHFSITPPAAGGTAKRIGRPPFWRSPADPITRLGDVYEAIARRAREVALNERLPGVERVGAEV